jgi:hypothetical protein
MGADDQDNQKKDDGGKDMFDRSFAASASGYVVHERESTVGNREASITKKQIVSTDELAVEIRADSWTFWPIGDNVFHHAYIQL